MSELTDAVDQCLDGIEIEDYEDMIECLSDAYSAIDIEDCLRDYIEDKILATNLAICIARSLGFNISG